MAQNAADKAKVDVQAAAERMRVLGADPDHPSAMIDIIAPASGVITEQNVNAAGGVKTLDNSPNLFTIADLSKVWMSVRRLRERSGGRAPRRCRPKSA